MTKEEAIEQLKSLRADRESFIQNEGEHDKVFLEDIKAIETILSMLEEKEKELQMLKDFKEIANSKVTELNPIRISKSKSIDK